ncbi:response regulator transcription factor [Thalassospira lucentensis]|uniref:response regulator transcription factor n=1 Tax=Thalassospira lucentensis TaxID=168935 RepID=UPI0029433191|nr:response regulator transcription factor [Thalassospira lucentensis]WOI08971.1 response regulator transcription factor [Thalassospira lucentensis]
MNDFSPTIKVIIVDDEEDFRIPVGRFLSKRGMEVEGVGAIEELSDLIGFFTPDIIVLDINLPGESGLAAVERLRRETNAGLIMATAQRGVNDRILGLTLGADSYLEKPLDVRELELVIRNLSQRVSTSPHPDSDLWVFDASGWTLKAPDGVSVRLSAAEYAIVAALAKAPGKPVTRDTLFLQLGKQPADGEDRSLDVIISRLRQKFVDTRHSLPLKSARGIGYVFSMVIMRGDPGNFRY